MVLRPTDSRTAMLLTLCLVAAPGMGQGLSPPKWVA